MDRIPASLAGLMGNLSTLGVRGTQNVVVHADENHFKRMATLLAMLAVKKEGDSVTQAELDPAILLKLKSLKSLPILTVCLSPAVPQELSIRCVCETSLSLTLFLSFNDLEMVRRE